MKKFVIGIGVVALSVASYFVFWNQKTGVSEKQPDAQIQAGDNLVASTTLKANTVESTSTKTLVKQTETSKKVVANPKPVPASKPAENKNTYTDNQGEYSINLPSGWVGVKAEHGANFTNSMFTDSDVAYSITVTPRKYQEDAYVKANGKVPTTQEMTDGFVRDQEDNDENWSTTGTTKTTLSGYETYVVSANYGGEYAKSKSYLIFTPNNIYNITRMVATSKLADLESVLNQSILSFKVQ